MFEGMLGVCVGYGVPVYLSLAYLRFQKILINCMIILYYLLPYQKLYYVIS